MHAIVRKGNREFYTSAVFGYYSDNKSEYKYGAYYIVLDEDKEHLVKKEVFDPKKKPQLDLMVLIIDSDDTGWIEDEHGFGGVDFLSNK